MNDDGLDHLSVGGKLIYFLSRGDNVEQAAYRAGIRHGHGEARKILQRPLVQRDLKLAVKAKEPPR